VGPELAAAIVAGARDRGLSIPAAAGFGSVTGQGVQATVAGHPVLVGGARLLAAAGIGTSALDAAATELSAHGKTPVLAAIDGETAGILAVADPVKDDSAAAIAALRRLGVDVVILTGDNARTAAAIARQTGVSRVLAEVLPGQKASEIRRLQAGGRTVGMVGDGINDAPALAAADVGLAIGTGTDVAIEAADFALAYNGIGIPVAAGILYPLAGIRLSPAIAAAAPVTDPVCGMTVDPATAAAHRGTGPGTVYFCSAGCAASFDADPGQHATADTTVPGARVP
jgi:Cu+-exporting ATPase